MALVVASAKKSPSLPVGARRAVHDNTRGLQNTSPIVRLICHRLAPRIVGYKTMISGAIAIIHIPGSITRKSSMWVVSALTMGGSIKHPAKFID
eukprot:CAMPEP_0197840772 /NCGR_PEP_ID=MMETSP1437-20131217/45799_1 /TAXON_ID=49252 ORGANISM="Eucampia antarctica, Strain CCMP1452" /NCGR_SAMPLE_ID=MMETSP1437 /ASSEMBLY_ACC=CAM_ASM_001096 /LENGTH=93 /DNA_ID=CAMNT_0043450433 /DNA_START=616 /DNA_END=897 /DNA_ORIENTATION=-